MLLINLTHRCECVLLMVVVQSQKPGTRPLPCFFGPKDFEALAESDCVFTRKMHPDVSGDLYAMLDQHISTH
jgi:hypothetical protein